SRSNCLSSCSGTAVLRRLLTTPAQCQKSPARTRAKICDFSADFLQFFIPGRFYHLQRRHSQPTLESLRRETRPQQLDGLDKRAAPVGAIKAETAPGSFDRIEHVVDELLADRLFPFPRSPVFLLFKFKPVQCFL